ATRRDSPGSPAFLVSGARVVAKGKHRDLQQGSNPSHRESAQTVDLSGHLSAVARRYRAILDSLSEIERLHRRIRPDGSLSEPTAKKRSARVAVAGLLTNELFRLRDAVRDVGQTGALKRRVDSRFSSWITGRPSRQERGPTHAERTIVAVASIVLNVAFA